MGSNQMRHVVDKICSKYYFDQIKPKGQSHTKVHTFLKKGSTP